MDEQLTGAIVGLIIGLILVAVLVVVFRWLWNSTLPEVFGVREVSFWQAFKIMLLAGILFGGHRALNVPQSVSTDPPTAPAQSHQGLEELQQ